MTAEVRLMFIVGAIAALVVTIVLTIYLGLHIGVIIMWVGILIVCPGSLIAARLTRHQELGSLNNLVSVAILGVGIFVGGLIVLVIMLAAGIR